MSRPAKAAIFILGLSAICLWVALSFARATRLERSLPAVQDRVVSLGKRTFTVESYLVDVARLAGTQITITGNSDGMVTSELRNAKVVDIFDNTCAAYGCVWGIDEDDRIWVDFWVPGVEVGAP